MVVQPQGGHRRVPAVFARMFSSHRIRYMSQDPIMTESPLPYHRNSRAFPLEDSCCPVRGIAASSSQWPTCLGCSQSRGRMHSDPRILFSRVRVGSSSTSSLVHPSIPSKRLGGGPDKGTDTLGSSPITPSGFPFAGLGSRSATGTIPSTHSDVWSFGSSGALSGGLSTFPERKAQVKTPTIVAMARRIPSNSMGLMLIPAEAQTAA